MRLKLYRAASMAEAMAGVRAELGPEALILGTRRVAGGIELTAALEPSEPPGTFNETQTGPTGGAPSANLEYHGVPAPLRARFSDSRLEDALAGAFAFDALPIGAESAPLLFVGPPGAGKTLTVARLATRLVMTGTKPLTISADGKRAGGVEQLAAFTRLLGIELLVAAHPVTVGRALARRHAQAPVLVDGPGIDPFDPAQREEIAALIGAAGAAVALVLPAGLDPGEAAEWAHSYSELGAHWLVATRLDQARRVGGVLAAADSGSLALSEAGIGSGAADGLIPITPRFLAERLAQMQTIRGAERSQ